MNGLSAYAVRKKEKEKRLEQQLIDYLFGKNLPTTETRVASDEVSYTQKHYQSMTDALAEVRKSKITHEDTTQVTRPNSRGF